MSKSKTLDNIFDGDSLSDEDSFTENRQIGKRSDSSIPSRMASIFGDSEEEIPKNLTQPHTVPTTSSIPFSVASTVTSTSSAASTATTQTVYSALVDFHAIVKGDFVWKGKFGLAILQIKNYTDKLLVIYGPTKMPFVRLPLNNSSNIELRFKDEYCIIDTIMEDKSFALLFPSSELSSLMKFCSFVMIGCCIDSVNYLGGNGPAAEMGASILFSTVIYKYIENSIEEHGGLSWKKARISNKSDTMVQKLISLKKGGTRLVRIDDTVIACYLKKVKFGESKSKKSNPKNQENDKLSEEPPSTSTDKLTISEANEDNQKEQEIEELPRSAVSDVRERMARIGQALLPMHGLQSVKKERSVSPKQDLPTTKPTETESNPEEKEEQNLSEAPTPIPRMRKDIPLQTTPAPQRTTASSEPATTSPAQPTSIPAPAQPSIDYASLHSVIGCEIDRLEIRLEAALQRMIDQQFRDFRNELSEIRDTQKELRTMLQNLQLK